MKNLKIRNSSNQPTSVWKRASVAVIASTLVLGGPIAQLQVSAAPMLVSQRQQGWDTVLAVARQINTAQQTQAIVLQMDVLQKPATSYANVVYQLFARSNNGRWVQVYNSTGARLVANQAGRVTLKPEVISLREIQQKLGSGVNLSNVEFQTVALVSYDVRDGQRNQQLRVEKAHLYNAIAQTTTTQIVSTRTTSTTQTNQDVVFTNQSSAQSQGITITQTPQQDTRLVKGDKTNNTKNVHRGHFSLAVLQTQPTLSHVTARVSLKAKRSEGFLKERFIGDFRYKVKAKGKHKAKFVRGLNPGDRVVVRLFDPKNTLIGFTEFELLSDFATVNLILPPQPNQYRIVRTVYGIDANEDDAIDSGTSVYDYFTQVTESNNVVFLSNTQNINTSWFQVTGLPTPPRNCVYTSSFQNGSFALVNRTMRVFGSGLASAITATPGQLVQTLNVSESSTSTYEASQLIVNYKEVGYSEGMVTSTDTEVIEVDAGKKGGKNIKGVKQNCNQGIGNGAEGCDPGKSRPHGGSNDEGGRTPGNKR